MGAQRRKETRETVAKGHAFPGRGLAIRAKDSPLPLILIERAQHTSAGSVAQAIYTCLAWTHVGSVGCLPNALPEKVWRHTRGRHSLRHSALPQKKIAPGLLCVKTLANPRRFLYNIPRRFRDLPTQSQSARNHRGFPGKEGRNTNGTQVFPKRHRNHEAGGY